MVTGATLQAIGQIKQGNEAARVGRQQQKVAELNAKLTEDSARQEIKQADRKARATAGAQVAGYASAGVDVNAGTPLDILADTSFKNGLDEAKIGQKARYQAAGLRYTGSETYRAGKVAQAESRDAAIGSLLGGFGNAAKAGAMAGGGG